MSATFVSPGEIGRAFSPHGMITGLTWADGPGWYGNGPLALKNQPEHSQSQTCPVLPRQRGIAIPALGQANGPGIANQQQSKGQRPVLYQRGSSALGQANGLASQPANQMRAEGPIYLTAPCLNRFPIS